MGKRNLLKVRSRRDVVVDDERSVESADYRREVVDVREVAGPRGGSIMLMRLACGHRLMERRTVPRKTAMCIACYVIKVECTCGPELDLYCSVHGPV